MSLSARNELTRILAPRYRAAGRKKKSLILDEYVSSTGYSRKHAVHRLNQSVDEEPPSGTPRKRAPRLYGEQVSAALVQVWEATNRLCSKRLVPYLPIIIPVLEWYGYLVVTPSVKKLLIGMSPASVDRHLYTHRHGRTASLSTTRPGPLLKHQIPIRTFTEWNNEGAGFLEVDTVAHCGTSMAGSYLNTLVLTDVKTAWTECIGLLYKDREYVVRAISESRSLFPFEILGLDTDNGSEFITNALFSYCVREHLTFTRSRPYKKNDQCFIEQKNGNVVRRLIGHDRYEGLEAVQLLNKMYRQIRLFVNFFQPSMRLISKSRKGAKTKRVYDTAQTPYARVLAAADVPESSKQDLKRCYGQLDPVQILSEIHRLQDALWPMGYQGVPSRTGRTEQNVVRMKEEVRPDAELRLGHRHKKHKACVHRRGTAHNAFKGVWDECKGELDDQPNLAASELLRRLQIKYPGTFKDSQKRTLQRRIRAWRLARDGVQRTTQERGDSLPDINEIELIVSSDSINRTR